MSGLNNSQSQRELRPQTKAEIIAQREQVRMLGIALGNWREAARRCGLSEGRVLNWVVRYGWKLPKRIEAPHPREMLSPVVGVVTPAESLEQRLKHDAEATRVGLSTATRKASASLAEREGDEVQAHHRQGRDSSHRTSYRRPRRLILGDAARVLAMVSSPSRRW